MVESVRCSVCFLHRVTKITSDAVFPLPDEITQICKFPDWKILPFFLSSTQVGSSLTVFRPKSQCTYLAGALMYGAQAERTFRTPLTIQYGVTVSHDSYVKTEVMGCNRNPLGSAQSAQNHKSGRAGKDSIWTPICVGPPPWWAVRTQSSDHSALEPGCAMGHAWGPAGPPLHWTHATTVVTWLEADACLSTCGCCQ